MQEIVAQGLLQALVAGIHLLRLRYKWYHIKYNYFFLR